MVTHCLTTHILHALSLNVLCSPDPFYHLHAACFNEMPFLLYFLLWVSVSTLGGVSPAARSSVVNKASFELCCQLHREFGTVPREQRPTCQLLSLSDKTRTRFIVGSLPAIFVTFSVSSSLSFSCFSLLHKFFCVWLSPRGSQAMGWINNYRVHKIFWGKKTWSVVWCPAWERPKLLRRAL